MVIYLCGPMSAFPDRNAPAFHKAAAHLKELEYTVINPVEIAEWHSRELRSVFVRECLEQLMTDAGAIALLPHWDISRRAKVELALAEALELPIYSIEPPFRGSPYKLPLPDTEV